MSVLSTIVDGYGQTGTRVYATLGDAPAPRVGSFIIVDDGTVGELFVGLSVAGSPAWVLWNDISPAVILNPLTSGRNAIVPGSGINPLEISATDAPAISVLADTLQAFIGHQTGTSAEPAIDLQRNTSTPSVPMVSALPGDGGSSAPVNGWGEITARTYSVLPTPTADHLGSVIRLIGGSGLQDLIYVGILNAAAAAAWLLVADGSACAPEFQVKPGHPDTLQISLDCGATWTDSIVAPTGSTGATGSTGSTGATGATGAGLTFPALPTDAASVTFPMLIPAAGCYLPWLLPVGYTVLIESAQGYWYLQYPTVTYYATTYQGSPTVDEGSFAVGRLIFTPHVIDPTSGAVVTQEAIVDGLALYTADVSEIALFMCANYNTSPYENTGYIVAQITVDSSSAPGCHKFDFTIDEQGWSGNYTGGGHDTAVYTPGVGWGLETDYSFAISIHIPANATMISWAAVFDVASLGEDLSSLTADGSAFDWHTTNTSGNTWAGTEDLTDLHQLYFDANMAGHLVSLTICTSDANPWGVNA